MEIAGHSASSFAVRLEDNFLWELTQKSEREQLRNLCLGEALEFIGRTMCQNPRDRFITLHILLNRNAPLNATTLLPQSTKQVCQWVWQRALANSDLSPLLLQPREIRTKSNPPLGVASWLVGYSGLIMAHWGLGGQAALAQYHAVTRKGVVKTMLDAVGTIERTHYLGVEESGQAAGVGWAMGILCSMASSVGDGTRGISASELVDGLTRIFPLGRDDTAGALRRAGLDFAFEGRHRQDGCFTSGVEVCIEEYLAHPPGSTQRHGTAKKIIKLLKYDSNIMGDLIAGVTRLTRSRQLAYSRLSRGVSNGEPICEVRCPGYVIQNSWSFVLGNSGGWCRAGSGRGWENHGEDARWVPWMFMSVEADG